MAKAKGATQDFVLIKEIRDNVVVDKNGGLCLILLASSVNFALKSAEEQEAILMQFQQFLNTIDFTLQIFIQSRRLNIEPYLAQLSGLDSKQDSDLMRTQLREYIEFIRTFTKNVDVMRKNFFVVVPYSPTKVNLAAGFTNLFSPKGSQNFGPKKILSGDQFEEHRVQLEQRASLVSEGLARVGVRTAVLQKDDLIDLFYHVYNPADITGTALPMDE